jgi:hypothetical protein
MLRLRTSSFLAGVLGGLSLLMLGTGRAGADVLPHSADVSGSAGNYTWTYQTNVTNNTSVNPGDSFEIIDFNGYNGTHSEPAGWTLSTSLSGPIPPGLAPVDDPTVTNLLWKYNGTANLDGPLSLGSFTAGSAIGTQGTGTIVASTTIATGANTGTQVSNISSVSIPVASPASPSPAGGPEVPEASTLALLGVGLPVVLHLLRRKRAANVA